MKTKKKAAPGLSPSAQAAWDQLDEETKRDIQKDNPFKMNRNKAIRELVKGKGLRAEIVKELSGLTKSTIYRILAQVDYLPDYAREDVRDLVRSFQAFINALAVVLADRRQKGKKGGEQ